MSTKPSSVSAYQKQIVSDLLEKGIYSVNFSEKIDCAEVCSKFQSLINRRDINYPRKPIVQIDTMDEAKLSEFHSTIGDAENRISQQDFLGGEPVWRDLVPFVTAKHPLLQIPEIVPFVFDQEIQDIASSFLGGEAKVGYVKLKKSYANKLGLRSYNHVFHKDDNGKKILKTLTYLKSVVADFGGGFTYVCGSKSYVDQASQYYYTDHEVKASFEPGNIVEMVGTAGTTIFADTKGLHKEGRAQKDDRWILIINYVLEEEYDGTGTRQVISKALYDTLDLRSKEMCAYINRQ